MTGKYFISVKGAAHGDLKGGSSKNPTLIPILGLEYGVTSPRDPATGQATGKRQYKPVTVYKEWGEISIELLAMMDTNEKLISVIIDEVRADPQGAESVFMDIHLINASLSEILVRPALPDDPPGWKNKEIEAVSFTFQRLEVSDRTHQVVIHNDWSQQA